MTKGVTIGEIAKALGLSRNTVSKALNGGEGITEATRQRVLDQAIAMNYKMLGAAKDRSAASVHRNILVVCRDNQLTNSFFGQLILDLQQLVRLRDGVMTLQFMSPKEVAAGVIPENLSSADGVIGLEILNKEYMSLLVSQGKPCVFFDGDKCAEEIEEPFDLVLEDDYTLYCLMRKLIEGGAGSLGFVGDPGHCKGFWNRYCYFALALQQYGLEDKYSILFCEPENGDFVELLERRLRGMALPEVFVCANAFVAERFFHALQNLSIKVPEQVGLVTFGSVSDLRCRTLASVVTSLRSVTSALTMLLFDRMENPDTGFRRVMTDSRIKWGEEGAEERGGYCPERENIDRKR